MTSIGTLARLRAVHRRLSALVEPLDDDSYRTQYHPDLSPIGWHLGHCAFIENYWLRERVLHNNRLTKKLHRLYFPQYTPKPERGPQLPPKEDLLKQVEQQHTDNILLLSGTDEPLPVDSLLEDEYLEHFLIQHHCMHFETMYMVLTQRALQEHGDDFSPSQRLQSAPPAQDWVPLPGGQLRIGGTPPTAFDNELPEHRPDIPEYRIARRPVSNAQYLAFMEAGGYEDEHHWGPEGWDWLRNSQARHPDHWRQDTRGWWYGIGEEAPYDLDAAEPVYGISHYEATAYAHWAGARLPHEYEWEVGARLGLLQLTGHVWEWCANTFFPYPDFEAFPYDDYSKPWFDGKHYTLRGASRYTRRDLRRPTFRNFYEADKRHMFAGLRLAL